MPWDFIVILAVMGILVPWRGFVRIRELLRRPSLSGQERIALYLSTIVLQWAAALIVLWRCRARGLEFSELGLGAPEPGLALSAAAALSLLLAPVQFSGLRRMARQTPEQQGLVGDVARKLMPTTSRERAVFAALAVTVAICEEFLYRGFALAALEQAFGGVLAAALLSSVFFAVAHAYQGRRGVASTFVVGFVFAAVTHWTGSLGPSIAAHPLVRSGRIIMRSSRNPPSVLL